MFTSLLYRCEGHRNKIEGGRQGKGSEEWRTEWRTKMWENDRKKKQRNRCSVGTLEPWMERDKEVTAEAKLWTILERGRVWHWVVLARCLFSRWKQSNLRVGGFRRENRRLQRTEKVCQSPESRRQLPKEMVEVDKMDARHESSKWVGETRDCQITHHRGHVIFLHSTELPSKRNRRRQFSFDSYLGFKHHWYWWE